jgi:integrase
MVYKQKESKYWWFKFVWKGELIRESTKQTNKRVAETMEAARRTELAKGEVGIKDRAPVPTLRQFAERDFLPFMRSTSAAKPRTVTFYETTTANLTAYEKLAGLPLDTITSEHIAGFVATRRALHGRHGETLEVSTLNRDLATLRRMFRLAQEWGKVSTILPRVKMLPGENQRERVLTAAEEIAYLEAAAELGQGLGRDYQRALGGIRATVRGEQPQKPDAFLLRDVTTVLIDCGLRPEECFRLKAENIRDGAIYIYRGKREGSRRRIRMSDRVRSILEMRLSEAADWVFPAETKSGHIEPSTLRKQHLKALKAAAVTPFEFYTLRHTCLTRWAKWMDPYTLHKVAGHTDMKTTMRYVHPSDADMDEAIVRARGGHSSGHSAETGVSEADAKTPVVN